MGQTWVDVGRWWLKAEREGGEVAVSCHRGMLAAAKCGKFCLRFVCDPNRDTATRRWLWATHRIACDADAMAMPSSYAALA